MSSYILHLGLSGFPASNAPLERIRLTFKALKNGPFTPIIINKHSVNVKDNIKRVGFYDGIPLIFTSIITYRPTSYILRNMNKLSGYLGEFLFLYKKRKKIHSAIFYESAFFELIYYRILSKCFRFKLVIQYVEFRSSIPNRQKGFIAYNDWLFDNYCFSLCDGIIVISEFLRNRVISKKQLLPIIKIPAINDFDEFKLYTRPLVCDYLMYCGSIVYLPVINFVINVYCKLKTLHLYNGSLLLVIGGKETDPNFIALKKKIDNIGFNNSIFLYTNISHDDLVQLYLGAELLIVPIRNTLQDIAGFHHKVGEYTAACKPIISNNIGEMKYYFRDGISAILADEYIVESYITKISLSLVSKEALSSIARNGHEVGFYYLNYKTYSEELKNFLLSI